MADGHRKGTAVERAEGWYAVITLGRGRAAKRHWERVTAPDGMPVDAAFAARYARRLQQRADAGSWSKPASKEPVPPTFAAFARWWIAAQTYESAPSDARVIERYVARSKLGQMRTIDIRPMHLAEFIDSLRRLLSRRGGTLAPRSVRNAYSVARRALAWAAAHGIIERNPAKDVEGVLPVIEDKHPGKRAEWIYECPDIVRFASDPWVDAIVRIDCAIAFCTGARIGERAVLRWRDWDPSTRPLGQLVIARARKSVSGRIGPTKTGAMKRVPVHPFLARVLEAWHSHGWRETYGRDPTDDDYIVPARTLEPRDVNEVNGAFQAACRTLGVASHHQHTMRHTFITRAQDGGADGSVLRWATHAAPSSAFDGYSRAPWQRLCEAVLCLDLATPSLTDVVDAAMFRANSSGKTERAREDSNL